MWNHQKEVGDYSSPILMFFFKELKSKLISTPEIVWGHLNYNEAKGNDHDF